MRKWLYSLLAAGALVAAGLLQAAFGPGPGKHLDAADCASCHLAGKNVTPEQAGLLTANQEVLCARCHAASIQLSHPSGLQPARVPPAGFPLDWKGDLTCSTCHDVHASSHGLLRGTKTGKALCFSCHDQKFFTNMRDGGASLVGGHLAKGIAPNGPALDAWSRKCMECHGANASPRLATSVDQRGVVRHASNSGNHPIGISYQKATAYGGYRPQRTVERRLMLPDGKVGCVSCHEGYRKDHGQLRLPLAGSALCYECHAL